MSPIRESTKKATTDIIGEKTEDFVGQKSDFAGFCVGGALFPRSVLLYNAKHHKNARKHSMVQKILLVRTSSMGDIIHTFPAAVDFKKVFPDAQLHWLVEESLTEVCSLCPAIDALRITAFHRWRKTPFSQEVHAEVRRLKNQLRSENYDAVVDTQGILRSAWAATWTGVPVCGYSWKTAREPLASFLYKKTFSMPETLGAVRRYRRMLATSLGYTIDETHSKFGICPPPLPDVQLPKEYAAFFVNTSLNRPKHWQEDRWQAVVANLASQGLDSVLFWGNKVEKDRVERIASVTSKAHVLPRMSIPQVAAVVARAKIGIGLDTGLMHLAAALAIPCVAIWVNTDPKKVALVGEADCATLGDVGADVSVDEVLSAVKNRI